MTFLPVLLLLIAAEGLRRGRRAAWWGALLLNLALAGLAMLLAAQLLGVPEDQLIAFGGLSRTYSASAILLPLTFPLLIAGLLLATRSSFDIRAPSGTHRRLTAVVLITVAAVSTVYVVGGSVLREDFDRPPTITDLLLSLPARFVPPANLTELDPGSCRPDRSPPCCTSGRAWWFCSSSGSGSHYRSGATGPIPRTEIKPGSGRCSRPTAVPPSLT